MLARLPKRLPLRMEKFCQAYSIHGNGSQAVIEAGYSPGASTVQATALLKRPEIKERIAQLMRPMRAKMEATHERVLQELSAIAFADIREIYDEHGRIKPIHELEDHVAATIAEVVEERRVEGRGDDAETVYSKRVKSHSKMQALEMLMKHRKMYTDAAQTTVNVQNNVQAITVNDLRNLPAEEQSLLRQLVESRARRSEEDVGDAGPSASGG